MTRIRVIDTSLRDGSHAVAHQFTVEQVSAMVSAMDGAGVPVIEVAHGDGLGGSSLTYGRSGTNERALIEAACEAAEQATIAALILPGVGTVHDIKAARELGVGLLRVATHASEADISAEHFGAAHELLRIAGERKLVGGQEDLLVDIAVAQAADGVAVI